MTYDEMKRMALEEGFFLYAKREDWKRIVAVIEAAKAMRPTIFLHYADIGNAEAVAFDAAIAALEEA